MSFAWRMWKSIKSSAGSSRVKSRAILRICLRRRSSSKAGGWASLIWFSRRTSRLRCPLRHRHVLEFIFLVPIQETRWVKAVEIRPGDKRYVHHANLLVDREGSSRKREAEPGAGFGGMEIRIESRVFDPDSHLLFWKPGTVPYVEPEGMALRLDQGTDLILNTHLQPSGKPEVIQPSIGLYFTPHPATKLPMLLQLENDAKLDIPAGQKDFWLPTTSRCPSMLSVGHLSACALSGKRYSGVRHAA